ncbi:DUF2515 family protein [Bdellovibrio sp. HCB337]|uniref:DUF2515 family protein n=1 Tax=Bdellovibrio sp. HCB337 TaxID=3394358 RepID=UPI0039A4F831
MRHLILKSFLGILFFSKICFASDYAQYDQFLSTRWPVPNPYIGECETHNPKYWQWKAQSLISVDPIKAKMQLDDEEVMVLRNLLISQAYNRLFVHSLKNQNVEKPTVKFFWIAAGSQASVTIGHALQEGVIDNFPNNSRAGIILGRLKALRSDLPTAPSIMLKHISDVTKKTAENNWRVYSDIYWQHLAYLACGYKEVVELNKLMISERLAASDKVGVDHYERFIQVWTDMEAGRYLEANMALIYLEQYNILQKHMYNGIDAKTANALLLFNQMAKAELKGPGGREITPFTQFAIQHKRYPNLSDFPTRFEWMKYVVSEQAAYLKELGTVENVEAILQKSLFESYQAISDYLVYAEGAVWKF